MDQERLKEYRLMFRRKRIGILRDFEGSGFFVSKSRATARKSCGIAGAAIVPDSPVSRGASPGAAVRQPGGLVTLATLNLRNRPRCRAVADIVVARR